ncbi:acyltransferase family protein [bacterium AH-315-K03]|nr:acyltransferase family protein [bacterium AH-315-K03]
MYLNSINIFRAIAILTIVINHSFYNGGAIEGDSLLVNIIASFTVGSSSFFIFISGFMLHHIIYKKYSYTEFIARKFKFVFLPYLLMSSIPIVINILTRNSHYDGFFLSTQNGFWYEFVSPFLTYLWMGLVNPIYWFIPFILVMYSLYPLHVIYIKQNTVIQLIIFFSLLALSMLIHRGNGYHSLI